MKETLAKAARIGIPVLIVAGALVAAALLIVTEEDVDRAEPTAEGLLVETQRVDEGTHRLDVDAAGEITAAREVNVEPQVSGRVVEVNDRLTPGGILEEGELLFRIDPSDYRLAVEEQRTAVEEAKAALRSELGRQEIARREWELFEDELEGETGDDVGGGPDEDETDPSLALREPQLRSAQVAVEAAQARLERARLDLERTTIEAPFDAFVESESVEVGQTVGPQAQVAHLVGSETFWVRISVPVDDLPYIDVPGVNAETGSTVRVLQDVDGDTVERRGRIVRLLGDLEEAGRMAQVLAAIDDPFSLDDIEEDERTTRGVPLLLNAYVDVQIRGPRVDELIEVPREALDEGDRVRLFEDGRLAVRPVDIAWRREDSVLVESGLEQGERVVVSPLTNPVEGMRLRTAEEEGENEGGEDEGGEESGQNDDAGGAR